MAEKDIMETREELKQILVEAYNMSTRKLCYYYDNKERLNVPEAKLYIYGVISSVIFNIDDVINKWDNKTIEEFQSILKKVNPIEVLENYKPEDDHYMQQVYSVNLYAFVSQCEEKLPIPKTPIIGSHEFEELAKNYKGMLDEEGISYDTDVDKGIENSGANAEGNDGNESGAEPEPPVSPSPLPPEPPLSDVDKGIENSGANAEGNDGNVNIINPDVIKTETPITFQSTTLGGEIPLNPINPFFSMTPEVPEMNYGLPQPRVVISESEASENIENSGVILSNIPQSESSSPRSFAVDPIDPDLFNSGEGEGNIENSNSDTNTPIDPNADDNSDVEFDFAAFDISSNSNIEDSLNVSVNGDTIPDISKTEDSPSVSVNGDTTPDISSPFDSEEFQQLINCFRYGKYGGTIKTSSYYIYEDQEKSFEVEHIDDEYPIISSTMANGERVVIKRTPNPGALQVMIGANEQSEFNSESIERFNECIKFARQNSNKYKQQIEGKFRELSNSELDASKEVIVDKSQNVFLSISFMDNQVGIKHIFKYDPKQSKLVYSICEEDSQEETKENYQTSVEFGNEFFQKFYKMVSEKNDEIEIEDEEFKDLKREGAVCIPICNIDNIKYGLISNKRYGNFIVKETTNQYQGRREQTIFRVNDGASLGIDEEDFFELGDIKDYKKEVSDLISHLQSIVNNSEPQLYENGDETGYSIDEKSPTGEVSKKYYITKNFLEIQEFSGSRPDRTIQMYFREIGTGAENKVECTYIDSSSEPNIPRQISSCNDNYIKFLSLYDMMNMKMQQSEHDKYDTLFSTNRFTQDTNQRYGLGASNSRDIFDTMGGDNDIPNLPFGINRSASNPKSFHGFDAIGDDDDTLSLSSSINRSVSNPKSASTLDAIDDEPDSNSDDSNSNLNDSNYNLNDSNEGLVVPLDDKDKGLVVPLDDPDEGVSTSSDTLTHDFNFQNYGNIVNYRGEVLLEGINFQGDSESMIAKKRLKEISQALSSKESQNDVKLVTGRILQGNKAGPIPPYFTFLCEFKHQVFEYQYIPSISTFYCFQLEKKDGQYFAIEGRESTGYMSGATAAEIFIPTYVKAKQSSREKKDTTVKLEDINLIKERFYGRGNLQEGQLFFPLCSSVEINESGDQQTRHNYLCFTEPRQGVEPDFYVVQDVVQENGNHQMYVEKNTFNKDDKETNKIDSKGNFRDPSEKYYKKADQILNELERFYDKSDEELIIIPPEKNTEGWIIKTNFSKTSFVITNNTIVMITRDGIGGATEQKISIEDGEIKYTETGYTKKEQALLSYDKDMIMEKFGECCNKMLDRCHRAAYRVSRPKIITEDDMGILDDLITGYKKAIECIMAGKEITRKNESFTVQDKDDKDKSYEFNQDSFTIITKKSEQSAQYQTFHLKAGGEIETESYILETTEVEDEYKKKDLKKHSIYVQPESVQNFSNGLLQMCDLYKRTNPVVALEEDIQNTLEYIESQPTKLTCVKGETIYDLNGLKGEERIILNPDRKTFMHVNYTTNKAEIYTLHDNHLNIEYVSGSKNEKELTPEEKERINGLFDILCRNSQQYVEAQKAVIQTEMQDLLEQFGKNPDKVEVLEYGYKKVVVTEDDGHKIIKINPEGTKISYQKGNVAKSYVVDEYGSVTCTSYNVDDIENPIEISRIIVDGIDNDMTNQHGAILPGQNGQTIDPADRDRYIEKLIGTLEILSRHINERYEGISIKREDDAIKIECAKIGSPVTIRGNSISIQSIDNSEEGGSQETTYNFYGSGITIKNDNGFGEIALVASTSQDNSRLLEQIQNNFIFISKKIENDNGKNIHENKRILLNDQVDSICSSILKANNIEVDSQSQMVTVQEVDKSRQQVTTITMQQILDGDSYEWQCKKETTIEGTSVESIGIIIDKNNKAKYQNDKDGEEIEITPDNQRLLGRAQQYMTDRILIKNGTISENGEFVDAILRNMRNSFEEFKKRGKTNQYTLAQDEGAFLIENNVNNEAFIIDKKKNTINYIYPNPDNTGENLCTVIEASEENLIYDNAQNVIVSNYQPDGTGEWELIAGRTSIIPNCAQQYQEYFDELYKDMQGQYEKHMIFDEILKPIANTSLDNLTIQEGEDGAKQITLQTDERFQIKYTGSSEQNSSIEIILLPQQEGVGIAKKMTLSSEGYITLAEDNGDEWSNEKKYQLCNKLLYCINDETKTACSEDECMIAQNVMNNLLFKIQQNSATNENQEGVDRGANNGADRRVDEVDEDISSNTNRHALPEEIDTLKPIYTFKPFNPLDYAKEEPVDILDEPLIPQMPIPTTQPSQNPFLAFMHNPASPVYNPANPIYDPANPADNSRGTPIPGSRFPAYGIGSNVFKGPEPMDTIKFVANLPKAPTGPVVRSGNGGGSNSNSNRNNTRGTNTARQRYTYDPRNSRMVFSKPLQPQPPLPQQSQQSPQPLFPHLSQSPQQPQQPPLPFRPGATQNSFGSAQSPFSQLRPIGSYSPSLFPNRLSFPPLPPHKPGTTTNPFSPGQNPLNSNPLSMFGGDYRLSQSPQQPPQPPQPPQSPQPQQSPQPPFQFGPDVTPYQFNPGQSPSNQNPWWSPGEHYNPLRPPLPQQSPQPPFQFGPDVTPYQFNPGQSPFNPNHRLGPGGDYSPSQPPLPPQPPFQFGPGGHNYGYSTEEELEEEKFDISPISNIGLRNLGNGRPTSRYKGRFDKVTSTEGLYEAISDLVNTGVITNGMTAEADLIFTDMYQRAAELCNFDEKKMLHTFNEFLDKADKNTYAGHENIKNAVLDFMQTSVQINQDRLPLKRDILLSDQIDNKYKSEFEERVVKLYLGDPKDYEIAKDYHDMQDYICIVMNSCVGDERATKYADKMFTNMEKAFIDGVGEGLAARDDREQIIKSLTDRLGENDGITPTTKVDMLSRVTPKILKNIHSDNLVQYVENSILSKDMGDVASDREHIPHIQAFFSSINNKESAEKAYKNFSNIILSDNVINNTGLVAQIFKNFKEMDEKAYNKMIDGVIGNLDEKANYNRLKTLLVGISEADPSIGIDLYHKLSQKQSVDKPALTKPELSQLLEATGLAEQIKNDKTLSSNYEIIYDNILTKREGRDIEKILSSIPLSPEKRNTLQQQLKLLSTPEEIFELLNSTIKNNNSLVNGEFDNERIDLLNSSDKDAIRKNFQKKELVDLFTGKSSTELDSSREDFYRRIEKYAENMYIPWWHNRLGSQSKRERAKVRKLAQNLRERDQKFKRERDCLQTYAREHFLRAKEAATYIAQYEYYTKIKENVGGKYTEKQMDLAKQALKKLAHKHSYSFTAVFKDWKKVGFWNTFLGLINKEDRFYINAKRALESSNKKLAVIYGTNIKPGSFSQNGPCYTIDYEAVPDAKNMSFTSVRLKRMLNGGILSPFKYWSRHKYFKNITVSRDTNLNAAQKMSKEFLENSSNMRKKGIEILDDDSFFDTNNVLANLRVDSKNITDKEINTVISKAFSKDKGRS